MNSWSSGLRAGIVAVLVSLSLALTTGHAASAATINSPVVAIAADITAAFGTTTATVPLSPDDLLLKPDTAGVTPIYQGGLAIWANTQPGVSYAARSFGVGGTQQFVHIASSDTTTNYAFSLKAGYTARPGPAGSAVAYNASGQMEAVIPAPLAKDARGMIVPSHFEFAGEGTKLIKVVEHHSTNVAYPVVADPIMIMLAIAGMWFLNKCVINGAKEAKALKGQRLRVVVWGVAWECVSAF